MSIANLSVTYCSIAIDITQFSVHNYIMSTKYRATIQLESDRDADTLSKFFERALELGKLSGSVRITQYNKRGRKSTNTRVVVDWVSKKTRSETFTASQCAKELNLVKSSAWRILQRMVDRGMLVREESPWETVIVYRRAPKRK